MNRRCAALPVLVLSVALTGCGSSTPSASSTPSLSPSASAAPSATPTPKYPDEPAPGTASAPCGSKITRDAAVSAKLPKGFPVVTGWIPTSSVTQGRTVAVKGAVAGTPTTIPGVRDAAFTKILAVGYTKTGSDQEPGFEADGDFTGPHDGNINVKTLCQGYLVLTYTFSS